MNGQFQTLFKKVLINVALLNATKKVPKYTKFLKELCTIAPKQNGDEAYVWQKMCLLCNEELDEEKITLQKAKMALKVVTKPSLFTYELVLSFPKKFKSTEKEYTQNGDFGHFSKIVS